MQLDWINGPAGVGIVGYGAYIPRYRVPSDCISDHWGMSRSGRSAIVPEKSLPGADEDTTTMSIEAARNALSHSGRTGADIGAVWVGTSSKPYSVKPCAITVAEALGTTPAISAADLEFACKAGTEALSMAFHHTAARAGRFALAVGMDAAQGRPGDELEMTAGAGGAAFITGAADMSVAVLESTSAYATDTTDFFRGADRPYPEHGRRFTARHTLFEHTLEAARSLMTQLKARATDFTYVVFHQPNPSVPRQVAAELGFCEDQIRPGLVGDRIGNCYAGSTLLGLAATLDVAAPGERILCVSYGSGAGSDAFSFRVTGRITERRAHAQTVASYLERGRAVDYATYLRMTGHIARSSR